jgi:hypothetical protein
MLTLLVIAGCISWPVNQEETYNAYILMNDGTAKLNLYVIGKLASSSEHWENNCDEEVKKAYRQMRLLIEGMDYNQYSSSADSNLSREDMEKQKELMSEMLLYMEENTTCRFELCSEERGIVTVSQLYNDKIISLFEEAIKLDKKSSAEEKERRIKQMPRIKKVGNQLLFEMQFGETTSSDSSNWLLITGSDGKTHVLFRVQGKVIKMEPSGYEIYKGYYKFDAEYLKGKTVSILFEPSDDFSPKQDEEKILKTVSAEKKVSINGKSVTVVQTLEIKEDTTTLCPEGIKSIFTITVKNTSDAVLKDANLSVEIPKEVTSDASKLSTNKEFKIVGENPLVLELSLGTLLPGESSKFSYSIAKEVSEELSNEAEDLSGIMVSGAIEEAGLPPKNNQGTNGGNGAVKGTKEGLPPGIGGGGFLPHDIVGIVVLGIVIVAVIAVVLILVFKRRGPRGKVTVIEK